jgi:hypothetical protein
LVLDIHITTGIIGIIHHTIHSAAITIHIAGIRGNGAILLIPGIPGGGIPLTQVTILIVTDIILLIITVVIIGDITGFIIAEVNIIKPGRAAHIP